MEWIGIAALVISLVALGVGGWQMYMSHSRYKELKCTQDRILDYLHKEFGLRLKGSAKFDAPEMTATVKVRKRKKDVKKPAFRLTLRRLLGKLLP